MTNKRPAIPVPQSQREKRDLLKYPTLCFKELLHKLFDEISEEVEQNLDNIAGRAAQLVGTAEGKIQPVGLESYLREYPLTLTSGHDQVTALADALSSLGKNVRQAIGQSFEYGDAVTANTFTRVSRSIEKWLWMVQAHLQEG
jgi:starvation-inducible DNA-binding protein